MLFRGGLLRFHIVRNYCDYLPRMVKELRPAALGFCRNRPCELLPLRQNRVNILKQELRHAHRTNAQQDGCPKIQTIVTHSTPSRFALYAALRHLLRIAVRPAPVTGRK